MAANENCASCTFATRIGDELVCRRFPPVLRHYEASVNTDVRGYQTMGEVPAVELHHTWEQPVVSDDQWCGEYRWKSGD